MPPGFVGRRRELDVLGESLQSAAAGQPRCVLIDGEGGSGKTSVLRAFAESVSDASLVMAAADESEAALRYGVVDELARQLRRIGPPTPRRSGEPADPFVAGASLVHELGRGSLTSPLVVIVDDVHQADAPSIAALTFAVRRLQVEHVLVVLAARQDGTGHLPPGLLRHIRDRGTRLTLGPSVRRGGAGARAGRGPGAAVPSRRRETARPHRRKSAAPQRPDVRTHTRAGRGGRRAASRAPLTGPAGVGLRGRYIRRCSTPCRCNGCSWGERDPACRGRGSRPGRPSAGCRRAGERPRPDTASPDPQGLILRFLHPLVRAAVYDDIGLVARAGLHARAAEVSSGAQALRHRVAATVGPDPALVSALRAEADRHLDSGRAGAAGAALLSAHRLCVPGTEKDRLLTDALELLLLEGDLGTVLQYADGVGADPRQRTTVAGAGPNRVAVWA